MLGISEWLGFGQDGGQACDSAGVQPKAGTLKAQQGKRGAQRHRYTKRTLGVGRHVKEAVRLPPGEDNNDWLASHCIDFFQATSMLVGIAVEENAPKLEPGWGFPPGYEYLAQTVEGRTVKCSGPEYVEHVLTWAATTINDKRLFPVGDHGEEGRSNNNNNGGGRCAVPYPPDFDKLSKGIFKRLFRVFAILYTHYYQRMESMGAVAHLNTTFKHFMFFVFEFDLVPVVELEALDLLVERLRAEYDGGAARQLMAAERKTVVAQR